MSSKIKYKVKYIKIDYCNNTVLLYHLRFLILFTKTLKITNFINIVGNRNTKKNRLVFPSQVLKNRKYRKTQKIPDYI